MQASCNDSPESIVHANLNTVYAKFLDCAEHIYAQALAEIVAYTNRLAVSR